MCSLWNMYSLLPWLFLTGAVRFMSILIQFWKCRRFLPKFGQHFKQVIIHFKLEGDGDTSKSRANAGELLWYSSFLCGSVVGPHPLDMVDIVFKYIICSCRFGKFKRYILNSDLFKQKQAPYKNEVHLTFRSMWANMLVLIMLN